ncbi:MAG: hypothetical protein H6772_04360 [Pseudomonadales bacterium]|nr:hypothetical protein [Pseudomonadales bacterium]
MRVRFPLSAPYSFDKFYKKLLHRNLVAPKHLTELFTGYKYEFTNGPLVKSLDQIEQDGLNCQLLVHMALEELGFSLPKWMRSSELFEDEVFLETVLKQQISSRKLAHMELPDSRVGDIWFFSNNGTKSDNSDSKFFHLAVVSQVSQDGMPILLHARKEKGQDAVVEWGIDEFKSSELYRVFQGIKRPRREAVCLSESEEQFGYEIL